MVVKLMVELSWESFLQPQFLIPVSERTLVFFDRQLFFACLIVWLIGTLILSRVSPTRVAMLVMLAKVILVASFFILWYQPQWKIGGDDGEYFREGLYILGLGVDPWEYFRSAHFNYLLEAESGRVAFYSLIYLAMYFLGGEYYSVVLLLVLSSTITAYFLACVDQELWGSKHPNAWTGVVFALHWVTITWTSFLILKEPIVMMLLAGALYGLTGENHKARILRGAVGIACLLLLFRVRFYMPYIFLMAVFFGGFLHLKPLLKVAIIPVVFAVLWFERAHIGYFMGLADLPGAFLNGLHFVLQPAFWRITEPAEFMWLQAVLHWVAAPFTALGLIVILRRRKFLGVVILAMIGGMIAFYSFIPELASTRHRMPIDSLFIFAQLAAIRVLWQFWNKQFRQEIRETSRHPRVVQSFDY